MSQSLQAELCKEHGFYDSFEHRNGCPQCAERAEVFLRSSRIIGMIGEAVMVPPLPADHLTATALVMTAALMVRVENKASRDQWLASCGSCYDAAKSVTGFSTPGNEHAQKPRTEPEGE